MKLDSAAPSLFFALLVVTSSGCALIPETRYRDSLHNPFPQLKRVAILPFYNQSSEPTVNGDRVAEAYYAALQAIPGFEVMPIGVTKAQWFQYAKAYGEPQTGEDFQRLAEQMGVEAVVVGSVTDFQAYYPPRMAMTVHWYAANKGFHPIPAGYGLPWGTGAEKSIPQRIVREAEFELARSQLSTQTPVAAIPVMPPDPSEPQSAQAAAVGRDVNSRDLEGHGQVDLADASGSSLESMTDATAYPVLNDPIVTGKSIPHAVIDPYHVVEFADDSFAIDEIEAPLPPDWPDPTDLIPDPPAPVRPLASTNHSPVLSHTRLYQSDDPYFTTRLADYVETGDDARPGGWQGYLKRSDDFIRFCCHLHIAEMLESRGGSGQSDLILRWPLSRY